MTTSNALILAGNRREGDSVASLAGVSHKALAPINGIPMLLRLYRTLRASPGAQDIYVCIDDGALLDDITELADARDRGMLKIVPPAASPAATPSPGASTTSVGYSSNFQPRTNSPASGAWYAFDTRAKSRAFRGVLSSGMIGGASGSTGI